MWKKEKNSSNEIKEKKENKKEEINKSEVISFNEDMKKEFKKMVNDVIHKFLDGKKYEEGQSQSWCNAISEKIIYNLNELKKGLKFICSTTIFRKSQESLHFSANCLWNSNLDSSIIVQYENEYMHCFLFLVGIAP